MVRTRKKPASSCAAPTPQLWSGFIPKEAPERPTWTLLKPGAHGAISAKASRTGSTKRHAAHASIGGHGPQPRAGGSALDTVPTREGAIPTPFLAVLVLWLGILFTGFGLVSVNYRTAIATLFVCALSVSGAIFLIEDIAHPLEGLMQISRTPAQIALSISANRPSLPSRLVAFRRNSALSLSARSCAAC